MKTDITPEELCSILGQEGYRAEQITAVEIREGFESPDLSKQSDKAPTVTVRTRRNPDGATYRFGAGPETGWERIPGTRWARVR